MPWWFPISSQDILQHAIDFVIFLQATFHHHRQQYQDYRLLVFLAVTANKDCRISYHRP